MCMFVKSCICICVLVAYIFFFPALCTLHDFILCDHGTDVRKTLMMMMMMMMIYIYIIA